MLAGKYIHGGFVVAQNREPSDPGLSGENGQYPHLPVKTKLMEPFVNVVGNHCLCETLLTLASDVRSGLSSRSPLVLLTQSSLSLQASISISFSLWTVVTLAPWHRGQGNSSPTAGRF